MFNTCDLELTALRQEFKCGYHFLFPSSLPSSLSSTILPFTGQLNIQNPLKMPLKFPAILPFLKLGTGKKKKKKIWNESRNCSPRIQNLIKSAGLGSSLICCWKMRMRSTFSGLQLIQRLRKKSLITLGITHLLLFFVFMVLGIYFLSVS